jgi:hypothetical protein
MPVWLQVLASLSAAVIGGIIAPGILQSRERRAARGAVLERVTDVESLWFADEPWREFRYAVAKFEAAAIVAGLPQELVRRYVSAAEIARRNSKDDMVDGGERITYIEPEYADQAKTALEYLGRAIWHPHLTRWSLRMRLMRPPVISADR